MKVRLTFATVLAVAALTSCTTISNTAYTDTTKSSIVNMTVADLDVKPETVSYTYNWKWNPFQSVDSRKKTAEYGALKEAKADVIVEPTYEVVKKGLFRGGSVTVSGHPATYVKFRPMEQKDAEMIAALEGRNLAVITSVVGTTAPPLMTEPKPKRKFAWEGFNAPVIGSFPKSYNRASIGYANLNADGEAYEGVEFQYIHGFGICKRLPFYIETGGTFDILQENISLAVPVNVAYRWKVAPNWSIQPFTGFNFKFNLSSDIGEGHTNVFQAGWQIGVGAQFKKWYAGINYDIDFNKIADDINSKVFSLKIGYCF